MPCRVATVPLALSCVTGATVVSGIVCGLIRSNRSTRRMPPGYSRWLATHTSWLTGSTAIPVDEVIPSYSPSGPPHLPPSLRPSESYWVNPFPSTAKTSSLERSTSTAWESAVFSW